MRTFVIHWLDREGAEYATTFREARTYAAAARHAARVFSKTVEHPSLPGERNPVGASGFWVGEVTG